MRLQQRGEAKTVALAASVLVFVHVLLSHSSRFSLVLHNIRGILANIVIGMIPVKYSFLEWVCLCTVVF